MIVYIEGPPLAGKSTLIRTLCDKYPHVFSTLTSETIPFPPGFPDHDKQLAQFGVHMALADVARAHPDKIWLVSRSFYSAAWHAKTRATEEYVLRHLLPYWEEHVKRMAQVVIINAPIEEIERRFFLDDYENKKGISLEEVRIRHFFYDSLDVDVYRVPTTRAPQTFSAESLAKFISDSGLTLEASWQMLPGEELLRAIKNVFELPSVPFSAEEGKQ